MLEYAPTLNSWCASMLEEPEKEDVSSGGSGRERAGKGEERRGQGREKRGQGKEKRRVGKGEDTGGGGVGKKKRWKEGIKMKERVDIDIQNSRIFSRGQILPGETLIVEFNTLL